MEPDAGPGCGHELCIFERTCFLIQDQVELDAHRADREHRREMGRDLAHKLGLGDDEGTLLEVVAYSPALAQRIAAGQLLCAALWALAERKAA